jgi:hypothetical protein
METAMAVRVRGAGGSERSVRREAFGRTDALIVSLSKRFRSSFLNFWHRQKSTFVTVEMKRDLEEHWVPSCRTSDGGEIVDSLLALGREYIREEAANL